MGRFVSGDGLNNELAKIIEEAVERIILMSPYIKLNPGIKERLLHVKDDPDVAITLVFGKSQRDERKNLSREDLEFLKEFPNIEIRHHEKLHAKYYANDTTALLTSMNLHDYAVGNNLEFGILLNVDSLFDTEIDNSSTDFFKYVLESSVLVFEKKPVFSEGLREYEGSAIRKDGTKEFFHVTE